LAEAQEMAESMVPHLKGGSSSGGGSDAFFTQSAINFLSCIYFLPRLKTENIRTCHILSFMNRSYQEIFDTLFTNEEIGSLLSPFKTAYDNKAFDQLEGQIGTLKIFLSRLATKESFWVFSGDEVELKITDRENPSILILASDPGTQDINSALYSSILNRTLRLINSKHNLQGGIIADEFPTIYIHKIDNVVATARSNRVAVLLGLQEIPQLRQFYKKEVADTISAIVGNIISGSARDKNTLDWLEKLFGRSNRNRIPSPYHNRERRPASMRRWIT
jgi:type IV secretory pathway TraG/TraD family ATPase VirD4